MQITVHRGTHSIGGCITEIRTQNARILIDMGTPLPRVDKAEEAPAEIEGVTFGAAACDGVFVTHYHGDHAGAYDSVLPSVPIYMGEAAKKIYATVQRTLYEKLGKGNPSRVESFRTFSVGKPVTVKDVKITPYAVDHSAYDAYMLLMETEGKRVLHTGDFRMHGAKGRKMPALFSEYAQDIDLLICEGTMLSRAGEKIFTVHDLGRRAKELFRANRDVFVLCSSTDIDAIAEYYHASIACRKPFIVCEDDFQTEILRTVTQSAVSSFYDFGKTKVYAYGENLHSFMRARGFCFLGRTNAITQKAMEAFPQSLLVYSMWRGYLDERHAAYDARKSEFVRRARENGARVEFLHTSGHASAQDIAKVCECTRAKKILPVHCEVPEAFLRLGAAGELLFVQDGESFSL